MTTLDTLRRMRDTRPSHPCGGCDPCRERAALDEAVRVMEREAASRIPEIVRAAHAAGWNGVENSKFLDGFIEGLAEERDEALAAEKSAREAVGFLNGWNDALHAERDEARAEVARLTAQIRDRDAAAVACGGGS